ncbi:MAG TPA: hypothetical protein VI956_01115 [Nitrospirota bacterium]|nr:hypothetical protein [Nitrospirota bacterium]
MYFDLMNITGSGNRRAGFYFSPFPVTIQQLCTKQDPKTRKAIYPQISHMDADEKTQNSGLFNLAAHGKKLFVNAKEAKKY